ncbi:MAG: roadblock/LC7 domain-containing protein [Promethearchaeota archaeon]
MMEIVKAEIQGMAIVNMNGYIICSVLSSDIDANTISAMSATILSISERLANELVLGEFKRILIESVNGIIILNKFKKLQNTMLCTLCKADAKLRTVFQTINSICERISEYIDYEGFISPIPFFFHDFSNNALSNKQKVLEILMEEIIEMEKCCKQCGSILKKVQKFCPSCGNRLE